MKRLFAAVAAAALFVSAGSAFAEDASGTIETVDPATGIIILDDGQTYTLAEGVSVEGLQPGDVVTVSFEVQDDKNMVTAVTKSE